MKLHPPGLVVPHEFPDQRSRDAELRVAVDVGIGWIVDLRDQGLESLLEDQRMQMRGPIGMPVLRLQQAPHHATDRNGIADEHHGAEGEVAISISRQLAAQVHVNLFGILVLAR